MAESAEQRLEALRKRWEEDRSSKAFVPLAEEYRKMGRLKDALAVLEQGMKIAPNHLSAQVALGRCRFDLGDFAGAIEDFERVVRQDPTQLVANKLLVEAHLRAGNLDQAAHRLDIYTLLNNRDPEIEPLRERIAAGARTPTEPVAAESIVSAPPAPAATPAASSAPAARPGDIFDLKPLRSPSPNLADAVPERRLRPPASGASTLFSGLGSAADRRRYVHSLLVGGVFGVAPAASQAEPAVEFTPPTPAPVASVSSVPDAPAMFAAPGETAEPVVLLEPEAEEVAFFEPAAEEALAPAAAATAEPTATLGELYLSQGHREEAETIFQRVLEHHPDNPVALEGLESARRGGAVEAAPSGVTARKMSVLQAYLRRLRGSTESHVS